MSLGLFKDNTDRDEEDNGPEPIPQRTVSKGSNDAFGDHLVVNEGIATPDMQVWYMDINHRGRLNHIKQKQVALEMAKRDKKARQAFFRNREDEQLEQALKEEEPPAWVYGFEQWNLDEQEHGFQAQFEHLKDNFFRAVTVEETGEKHVWIIQAQPTGDIVMAGKLENENRFQDQSWETRSRGKAVLKNPEMDYNPEEDDLDRELMAAEVESFSREELKTDDLEDEPVKEFVTAAFREYGLNEEIAYQVEYHSEGNTFRLRIDDGDEVVYSYNFLDLDEDDGLYFHLPPWAVNILFIEQDLGRIPHPSEQETGEDDEQ